MKLRPALVALALLLLTGSLASASSTAPAEAPASPADEGVALMTPADGTSDCLPDELAFLNAAPIKQATGTCGSCSGVCAGGEIGQRCGAGKACEYPYAQWCSDGQPKCYCWGGALP